MASKGCRQQDTVSSVNTFKLLHTILITNYAINSTCSIGYFVTKVPVLVVDY